MALTQEHHRYNPWWGDTSAIQSDPHLSRMRKQEFTFRHSNPFDFTCDTVYTLRGPRQVGKTTFMKLLIEQLIQEQEWNCQRVLYLDVQGAGLNNQKSLQESLLNFISFVRSGGNDGQLAIFLDEVTGITDWGTAIRTLYEQGKLENVTVLATGSHALDVKRGGESMPGRRGAEEKLDWIMMPLSFGDYVRSMSEVVGLSLPEKIPTSEIADQSQMFEKGTFLQNHAEILDSLWSRYLLTGGYPYAIENHLQHQQIEPHIYNQLRDAILEEVRKAGHDETYLREIVNWLINKYLGKEFKWSTASNETEVGSKNTARNILENAEAAYVWHILYRQINIGPPDPALQSPKKIYSVDPLTWHTLHTWTLGAQDPWKETLSKIGDPDFLGTFVESIVGDHFCRQYGPFVLYYRDRKGRNEIDFLLYSSPSQFELVEVKYQNQIRDEARETIAANGGGVLVTKDTFERYPDENVISVPCYNFLTATTKNLTLFPDIK